MEQRRSANLFCKLFTSFSEAMDFSYSVRSDSETVPVTKPSERQSFMVIFSPKNPADYSGLVPVPPSHKDINPELDEWVESGYSESIFLLMKECEEAEADWENELEGGFLRFLEKRYVWGDAPNFTKERARAKEYARRKASWYRPETEDPSSSLDEDDEAGFHWPYK